MPIVSSSQVHVNYNEPSPISHCICILVGCHHKYTVFQYKWCPVHFIWINMAPFILGHAVEMNSLENYMTFFQWPGINFHPNKSQLKMQPCFNQIQQHLCKFSGHTAEWDLEH